MVIIIIPLLPSFEGKVNKRDGQLLRIQIDWHLKTIYKAKNSLINQIKKYTKNW